MKDTLIKLANMYSPGIVTRIYENEFIPMYYKKHCDSLTDAFIDHDEEAIRGWFTKRAEVFERYAIIHYKVK